MADDDGFDFADAFRELQPTAERLLREEQRAASLHADARQKERDLEERLVRFLSAFERIADVMELWADQQVDK